MSDFSDAAREYFGGAHRPEPHVPEPEEVTGDEVDGSTNPLAEYAEGAYLSAAAAWLVKVEQASAELAILHAERDKIHSQPEDGDNVYALEEKYSRLRSQADDALEHAGVLAHLNIRMATACGAYQDRHQRVEVEQPRPWLTTNTPEFRAWAEAQIGVPKVKTPDEVATEIREQVKADVEAHQAETLRPGIDPEPPEDGALWTADGEYFAFAVFPLERVIQRWLIIRRYTEFLSWQTAPEPKPSPATWEGLDGKIGYADDAPLRRPTAAERAAFYGPEPEPTAEDNAPTPPEHACGQFWGNPIPSMVSTCERCGASAAAHLQRGLRNLNGEVPTSAARQDRTPISAATLQTLTEDKLDEIVRAVDREWARRAQVRPERRSRGGAAQWREG